MSKAGLALAEIIYIETARTKMAYPIKQKKSRSPCSIRFKQSSVKGVPRNFRSAPRGESNSP